MEANAVCLTYPTHWELAQQAFSHTAAYDAAVFQRLARVDADGNTLPVETLPPALRINAPRTSSLRYGENPHQEAALYCFDHGGLASAQQLHGKELSYNNLVDLDAAWQLILEFEQPAAAIIKHTNPADVPSSPGWWMPIAKRWKPIPFPHSEASRLQPRGGP